MLGKNFGDRFNPIRLLEGGTMSIRAVDGELRLFLTLDDGREASRPISMEVAVAHWERRRHFTVLDAIAEMRAELGQR